MTTTRAVDFAEMAQAVGAKAQRWGAPQLAIWGGECAQEQVMNLLRGWKLPNEGMAYCIWETVRQSRFVETLPDDADDLERARIFGARGDLSLRREGAIFRWHFVGAAGQRPPHVLDGLSRDHQPPRFCDDTQNDFWQAEPSTTFLWRVESALLWGERKKNQPRWFEDRVARARLEYPASVPDNTKSWRVRIHYWTFSRAGQIEFVWFTRLDAEQAKEENHG